MGFAPTLAWLFIGRALAGVAGATYPTVNAYIADVTDGENRAQYFGYIAAAWSIGFMLGPALGGLLGEYGPRIPFFGAAVLAFLNLGLGLVALPESLAKASRRSFSMRRANPVGALLQLRHLPLVIGVLPVIVLYQLVHDANPSTWTYVTIEKFSWSPAEIGYSISAVAVLLTLVQVFGIRVATESFGEYGAVLVGWLHLALGYVGFAFATEGWMMYASMLPFAIGAITMPALRGILSGQVAAAQQGELAGAIASVMAMTTIAAPLLMTELFRTFSAANAPIYFPGAPFFAAGVLSLAGAVVFQTVTTTQRAGCAETT
jgi:DHA1 family tetracycline resistance protein-like MFS transporter